MQTCKSWLRVAYVAWPCCRFMFPQTSSECGSAVSTRSSLSDDEDMGWSFSCPPTAWHCFLKGRHTHCNWQLDQSEWSVIYFQQPTCTIWSVSLASVLLLAASSYGLITVVTTGNTYMWRVILGHCYDLRAAIFCLLGTRLRFHRGSNVEWQDVEDLDSGEEDYGDEDKSRSLKVHYIQHVATLFKVV